jgi:hypothetical protein
LAGVCRSMGEAGSLLKSLRSGFVCCRLVGRLRWVVHPSPLQTRKRRPLSSPLAPHLPSQHLAAQRGHTRVSIALLESLVSAPH